LQEAAEVRRLRHHEDPPEDIPEGGKKSELCEMLRGEVLSDIDWEDTERIQRKFHSGSFAARRETGYSVLGQLHDLPGKRKKFITLANRDVCENAWYIIHGLSRSAFFLYKSAAKVGSISGCHGNLGVLRPRAHTIQAEANMMTIINETAGRMPNST
jgi:hypothetical protein